MDLAVAQIWQTEKRSDTRATVEKLGSQWINIPEGRLVAVAQKGTPDAYGELVRRHQNAVYNVALRLLGDRDEALDITQEAFVRAYKALHTFDASRPFGPWINRIAANAALNLLEHRKVVTAISFQSANDQAGAPEAQTPPDYSAEPERLYLAGEQQALLRRAVISLQPRYRAVIELRHFQELTYEEIAHTLDIPLSDVKSYLFRARRELRKWLEEND